MDSEFERRDAAAFFTNVIKHKWEGSDPRVEITAPPAPHPERPGLHVLSVEYIGLTGRRETITTSTRDPRRDDDIGMEQVANHLWTRLGDWQERQPLVDQLWEHLASRPRKNTTGWGPD